MLFYKQLIYLPVLQAFRKVERRMPTNPPICRKARKQ